MQQKWKKFSQSFEKCPMFSRLSINEIMDFLICSKAELKEYSKGEIIISQGERISKIGILVSGKAQAVKYDPYGNEYLAAQVSEGNLFADLLAAGEDKDSPVTITVVSDCTACMIPWKSVLIRCGENCEKHDIIIENLIKVFSTKFFELFNRIDCLTARKVEDKVLTLLEKHRREGENTITLPFDREGMANYLGVDRSSLSRELSRMKEKGIIDYNKNEFIILEKVNI